MGNNESCNVEKWCHLPAPSQVLWMCFCFCPQWTGGNEEDSILLPALSCALLFSEGRAVFGLLWTGRKSRAMVCLCASEDGRLMSICRALIVRVKLLFSQGWMKPPVRCFFECVEEGSVLYRCQTVPEWWLFVTSKVLKLNNWNVKTWLRVCKVGLSNPL